MKNYTVFIGRFQPPHSGHLAIVKRALSDPETTVIIGIGSANRPRVVDNPFNFNERVALWDSFLPEELKARVHFIALDDKDYLDNAWVFQVKHRVLEAIRRHLRTNEEEYTISITGHKKDATSYYLKYFPEWRQDILENGYDSWAATDVRNAFYEWYSNPDTHNTPVTQDRVYGKTPFVGIPDGIWAAEFQKILRDLSFEYDFDRGYDPKRYHVNVITVDAVVVCNGHVLVVERKNYPGKGLYALPGGHINPQELLEDAMLRELREETGINLSDRVLRSNIVNTRYFDKPTRSRRARVITHAFLIHLKNEDSLPKIKGGDDAARAFWMPIDEVQYADFFEDHAAIVEHLVAGL
jgi:bifunctional NMN adenylyltransferase/nudix hydrolase